MLITSDSFSGNDSETILKILFALFTPATKNLVKNNFLIFTPLWVELWKILS